jgi:hypothetical protein
LSDFMLPSSGKSQSRDRESMAAGLNYAVSGIHGRMPLTAAMHVKGDGQAAAGSIRLKTGISDHPLQLRNRSENASSRSD